jgi:hypothetical protein
MKKILIILLLSNNVYAGVNNLTHGSRANCGVNETVSWDLSAEWGMYIESRHYNDLIKSITCVDGSEWKIAKKHNVSHWGEAFPDDMYTYGVLGRHWLMEKKYGKKTLAQEEYVTDCSQYDGWWDYSIKGEDNEN